MKPDIATTLSKIAFNVEGLVPAIAQDAATGAVLMMAWMNRDSVTETLTTGRVCYWSRSRQSLWRKGDTSGHFQYLKEFHIDCDGDTLLLKVEQIGAACHTGEKTCFFSKVEL
jgi:phosphoribosyl-AMP cyclohydrolase